MSKSEKIEVRVTPEFKARVVEVAGDVPVSRWVVRAIEHQLAVWRSMPPEERADRREALAVRQLVVEGEDGPPHWFPYGCPDRSCDWGGAKSPAATCPHHGRKVVQK